MSPWGKWYLSKAEFRPTWWIKFEGWRRHPWLAYVRDTWGWKVSNHLDILDNMLNPEWDRSVNWRQKNFILPTENLPSTNGNS